MRAAFWGLLLFYGVCRHLSFSERNFLGKFSVIIPSSIASVPLSLSLFSFYSCHTYVTHFVTVPQFLDSLMGFFFSLFFLFFNFGSDGLCEMNCGK